MPGNPPPVPDERTGLLSFLAQQRYVLTLTAHGLTDEQARSTPTVSTLSVGGLIKHVASTERGWMDTMLQRESSGGAHDYMADFVMTDEDTLSGLISGYDKVARETEDAVAGVELDDPVPVPQGVPWYPDDVDAWSVRWVLLHLIEETARHAGHADLVREAVDGGTAFPLMAAAEGWPATPWMQPWEPPPPA
jgi:uncharacterized damage-inducible protein DinB